MKILQAISLTGSIVFALCTLQPYPLLRAGHGLLLAAACVFVLAVAVKAHKDERIRLRHVPLYLLPWAFAAAVVANGALDRSPETVHNTVVVSRWYSRTWDRVGVRSWRPGRDREQLILKTWLFGSSGFYYPGEPITVGVHPGALGMEWFSSVTTHNVKITHPGRRPSASQLLRGAVVILIILALGVVIYWLVY